MSAATLTRPVPPLETILPCHVLVLYGDESAYDCAIEICRRVLTQFDAELPFAFACSSFDKLTNPAHARRVAEAVANADIILVSLSLNGSSAAVLEFLNRCASERSKTEGAMALVVPQPGVVNEAVFAGFSIVARRLRVDFLAMATSSAPLPAGLPEGGLMWAQASSTSFEKPSLDHWGLNE